MKQYFQELLRKEAEAKEELQKIQTAISSFQAICKHKFKTVATGSHYRYEECEICKHREKI